MSLSSGYFRRQSRFKKPPCSEEGMHFALLPGAAGQGTPLSAILSQFSSRQNPSPSPGSVTLDRGTLSNSTNGAYPPQQEQPFGRDHDG